ncbi:uncharacterized protein [Spinacia oleracea]|uniref:CCHC-type domain-containing protein n=1 Tax=Spinacia oleracea TaxID=3562 RepID=A0ABM3RHU6_SPIOL|nr:uncharacterized protein LOC130469755 [Spinacia oleracea]
MSINDMSSVAPVTASYCKICGIQGHFVHECSYSSQDTTQMEQRQPGTLPGQPTPPQGQNRESANAITLKSGTKYDRPTLPTDDATLAKENTDGPKKTIGAEPQIPVVDNANDVGANKRKEKISDSLPIVPKLPFPHLVQKTKVDQQLGKFLEMVKNLEVTVPFTDLISQVPVYANFLKEMITKKMDYGGVERISLTEECSPILKNMSPPKLKDPGSFSIPCHVGALFIDKALCDLGVSVSAMPLSDVHVLVGKFYIPVDFVVLDMEEDSQIPIILGRPFFYIASAVIDVKSGSLTLSVGDDTVTFNLTNVVKSPMLENTCRRIDVVKEISLDNIPRMLYDDPLLAVLTLEAPKGEGDTTRNDSFNDKSIPM